MFTLGEKKKKVSLCMEIQEKIFTLLAFPEVILTFVKVEKVTSELIHCLLNRFWGAWFFDLVLQ